MPANMRQKGIKFSLIAQDAINWYASHDRKDLRNFRSRMKIILDAFGYRIADDIKRWGRRCSGNRLRSRRTLDQARRIAL